MSPGSYENEARDTARTALFNTIANVMSMAFGIIVVPIITRIISTDDVGIANTFIVTRNILAIIVALGTYAFVYKAMLEFKDAKKNYLFTISVFCILTSAVFFAVILPFQQGLEELLSLTDFLFYWLVPSIVGYSIYFIASYYCIFHNISKITATMVLAVGPVAQVLSVLLAFFMPMDKYIGRVIGLDIPMIVIAVVFMIWLIVHGGRHFKIAYVLLTLRYSIALIPHALSQTLLTQLDLLMISFFIGMSAAGVYSMGYTIGLLAYTAMTQVMASWSTWVYRRFDEGLSAPVKKNSATVLLAGFLLSVMLIFVAPELITIFLPADYKDAIYILMPLAAGNFFQFLYLFFYDIGYYKKKTTFIAAASVVTALFNFVFNLIFIPRFGFYAAAYTTLASYMLLALLNYLIVRHDGIGEIYDVRFMVLLGALCLLLMAVSLLLVGFIAIRYLVLLVFLAIILKLKGKQILQFAMKLKR